MKRLYILIFSFLLISCFKEPKKENTVTLEKEKIKHIFLKEYISLQVLSKVIYFKENDFRDWCRAQDYKYQFSNNADNYCAVQYTNSDESEAVLINIPKKSDIKYNITYLTSNHKKYESILNELKKSNYILKSESEEEIEYYKVDSKVVININNILNEKVYSIDLYKK